MSESASSADVQALIAVVKGLAMEVAQLKEEKANAIDRATRGSASPSSPASTPTSSSKRAVQCGSKRGKKHWAKDPHLQGLDRANLEDNEHVAHIVRDFVRKLLGRTSATAPFPVPPTALEFANLMSRNPDYSTLASNPIPQVSVQFENGGFSEQFYESARTILARSGLNRLTFDLVADPELKGRYNLFVCTIVNELLRHACLSREISLSLDEIPDTIVMSAILRRYWSTLVKQAVLSATDPTALRQLGEKKNANKASERLLKEYRDYLVEARVVHEIIDVFNISPRLMAVEAPKIEQPLKPLQKVVSYPPWWSDSLLELMVLIEQKVQFIHEFKQINRRRGNARSKRVYMPSLDATPPVIPPGLPRNLINSVILAGFDALIQKKLRLAPPLDLPDNINDIFPAPGDDGASIWMGEELPMNGRRREPVDSEDERNSLFNGMAVDDEEL